MALIASCEGRFGGDAPIDTAPRDAGLISSPDSGGTEGRDAGFDAGAGGGLDSGVPDAGRVVDAGVRLDAGAPDTGVPDASTRPPGLVPMFVVSGWQGRLVSSCDDGRTWVAHDEVHSTSDDAFNDKGLSYANGVFMQLIGWGAICSFKRSVDGVTWQHLSLAEVGLDPMNECGGIGSTGDGFVMVHSSGQAYRSKDEGLTFVRAGSFDNHEYVRDVGSGGPVPGVIGAGGGNDPSGVLKNPPRFSIDRGLTWQEAPGCSTFNAVSVGQNGGVAYGNGRLVFVGFRGQVCTSSDLLTFTEAQLDVTNTTVVVQGRASFGGGKFWVGNGNTLFVSTDGLTWESRALPSGLNLHTVASSEETGTLVAFNQGSSEFYRSTDLGLTWQSATGPGAGPNLGRIVFGYGRPSADCPL